MSQTLPEIAPAYLVGTGYEDRLLALPPDVHEGMHAPGGLARVVDTLLWLQRESWGELDASFKDLDRLRQQEVALDQTHVVIQLNERRAGRSRPTGCFLDASELPEEQRGFAHANLFVSANPFPILPYHLTGIYPQHKEQSIYLLLQPALRLAQGLGNEFAVFYNGPMAGASAPQHAHIQAVRYPKLPVETATEKMNQTVARKEGESVLYLPQRLGRTILTIESPDITLAEDTVSEVIERLPKTDGDTYDEPRLNLMVRMLGDGGLRIFIAPRAAREITLANGSVLRPATLEAIAGLVVVMQDHDFLHLDGNEEEVARVFSEASQRLEVTRDHLHDLPVVA